jgi:hypothetical protein
MVNFVEEIKIENRGAKFLIEDTTLLPDGFETLKSVLVTLLAEENACLGSATQRDLISAAISNRMASVVSCLISELVRGKVFDPGESGGLELRKWSREEIHEFVLEQLDMTVSDVLQIIESKTAGVTSGAVKTDTAN